MEKPIKSIQSLFKDLVKCEADPNISNDTLGIKFLNLRESLGLTQAQLGEMISSSAGSIRRWETGTTRLPTSKLRFMAKSVPDLDGSLEEHIPISDPEKLIRITRLASKADMEEIVEIANRLSAEALSEILDKHSKDVAKLLLNE